MIILKGWWLWSIAIFFSVVIFLALLFICKSALKRKRILLIIILTVFLLGVGFLWRMGSEIWDIVRPISTESRSQGVEIFTDKEIYAKGESVKLIIEKSGSKKLYTGMSFSFYEGNSKVHESSGLSFYKLKDNIFPSTENTEKRENWEMFSIPSCGCFPRCIDDKIVNLCPMMSLSVPACRVISEGMTSEEWAQEECTEEKRQCGEDSYEISVSQEVRIGTYKVKFCFAGESDIDWSKGYCYPKEAIFGPGNIRPHCIETIFIIEE